MFLKNTDQVPPTEVFSVLYNEWDKDDIENGIEILDSEHNWEQWYSWKEKLREFPQEDMGITMLDIDESEQQLVIGLLEHDSETIDNIEKELIKNEIPLDEIKFIETGEFQLDSHGDTVSPMKGGAEIQVQGDSDEVYTTGFAALDDDFDREVVVTAGHCETGNSPDTASDETYLNPKGGSVIGDELSNPSGPRWSDSLLIDPSINIEVGKIYIDSTTTLTIDSKDYTQAVDDSVWQFGRTTHDTSGKITQTAVDITNTDYGTLYDQNIANYGAGGGDSGGPVYEFQQSSSTNVRLYGTHVGNFEDGIGEVFSPISNIEQDHGTLRID